jgi:hypothetical protein
MDTKEREKLITDAAAEFEAGLRLRADQFEATRVERKLVASVIETLWGETRKLPDGIIKRVCTGLTNDGGEKLVQEKTALGGAGITVRDKGKQERQIQTARVSGSLIREATEYAGRKIFEEDTRRAFSIEQNLDKIPDEPDRKGILYIMADGAAINTRLKDEQGSGWRG